VIAHRVEDLLDRRLDVDVDPNLVHPFMLHLHTPTAFALAPATKIDLDHLPELLGEMERLRALLWARLALRIDRPNTVGARFALE